MPSFTRNWLARQEKGRLPAPFSGFDAVTIAVSAVSLVMWIGLPDYVVTGFALIIAAAMQCVRLVRWAGDRTTSDRLVLARHTTGKGETLGSIAQQYGVTSSAIATALRLRLASAGGGVRFGSKGNIRT